MTVKVAACFGRRNVVSSLESEPFPYMERRGKHAQDTTLCVRGSFLSSACMTLGVTTRGRRARSARVQILSRVRRPLATVWADSGSVF